MLTQLKKYRSPIQRIPATAWTHRDKTSAIAVPSCQEMSGGMVQAQAAPAVRPSHGKPGGIQNVTLTNDLFDLSRALWLDQLLPPTSVKSLDLQPICNLVQKGTNAPL